MNALEALARCQRAWERSQPQLFMELWPDDGLDGERPRAPLSVEPAVAVASPEAGGLASRLTAGGSRLLFLGGSSAWGPDPSAMPPAVSRVLNPGAKPRRGIEEGLTASRAHRPGEQPAAALADHTAGSAPLTVESPRAADPWTDTRGTGQEVTF